MRILVLLLAAMVSVAFALPSQAEEPMAAPEGEAIYDEDGSQQYCNNSAVPDGYHCRQCRYNYDPSDPEQQYAKCVDIDNTGGSGYLTCRASGPNCEGYNACTVVVVY